MILEAGGELGFDPGPYSLRDLITMQLAARSERWDHTSSILAMVASFGGKAKPSDFHPYRQVKKPVLTGERIRSMKPFFQN